jgi:hypothetical protein
MKSNDEGRMAFFIGPTRVMVDETILELLGFLSIIYSPGDEKKWINILDLMHCTPTNVRAVGKRQQAALTRLGEKSIDQLSKLDIFDLKEVMKHIIRVINLIMIRRKLMTSGSGEDHI